VQVEEVAEEKPVKKKAVKKEVAPVEPLK